MSYTVSRQRSPKTRGTYTAATEEGSRQTRGTYVAPSRPSPNQGKGTYTAAVPSQRKGTYTAAVPSQKKGTYTEVAPSQRKGTYTAAAPGQRKGTYTAAAAGQRKGTYTAAPGQRKGTFVAARGERPRRGSGTYIASSGQYSDYEGESSGPPAESDIFDSYYIHSEDEQSLGSPGQHSFTAGRLAPAPPDVPGFIYGSFPWEDELPGPEIELEDDVFEPDQPAHFRATRVPPDFMRNFHAQNARRVLEYNILWNGLVDLLETYQPITNAQAIKSPIVLTEHVKQLIDNLKLEFIMFKIDSMLMNIATNPNFSQVHARINRSHDHIHYLYKWLKNEIDKVAQENVELQDQHAHLNSYLSYLEKKKKLLQDAYSSYPYHESLRKDLENEQIWSYHLRQQFIEAFQELHQIRESVATMIDANKNLICEQQKQLCQFSEQFEINVLYRRAIYSVLRGNEGGEIESRREEVDAAGIDDWADALGDAFERMENMPDVIMSGYEIIGELTQKEELLLASREELERLDFEVNIFSDNSTVKNETIALLNDIIQKGRDPELNQHANLYALREYIRSPDETFGSGLLDRSRLFSTPVRYADEPSPLDLTSGAQPLPGDISRSPEQLTPRRRPRSPGDAESVMIDDVFGFLDQSSSSGRSRSPLQSTFIQRPEPDSFSDDPPQSVFYPIPEIAQTEKAKSPKTKSHQRSLIPKFDRSRMRKAVQVKSKGFRPERIARDRPLSAISERAPFLTATQFPPKVQPSPRPPWNISTQVPKTKLSPPARKSRSFQMKSSPVLGTSHLSRIAPIDAAPRSKSLIPIPISRIPYRLRSPPTPHREAGVIRSVLLDRPYDTSIHLRYDWGQKHIDVQPQIDGALSATVRSDRTFCPTPAIWRRGRSQIPPIIYTEDTNAPPMNTTFGAAPPMNTTFGAAPPMNTTFGAAPKMNTTFGNAHKINTTFRNN